MIHILILTDWKSSDLFRCKVDFFVGDWDRFLSGVDFLMGDGRLSGLFWSWCEDASKGGTEDDSVEHDTLATAKEIWESSKNIRVCKTHYRWQHQLNYTPRLGTSTRSWVRVRVLRCVETWWRVRVWVLWKFLWWVRVWVQVLRIIWWWVRVRVQIL